MNYVTLNNTFVPQIDRLRVYEPWPARYSGLTEKKKITENQNYI